MNNDQKSESNNGRPEKVDQTRFLQAAELVYHGFERFCCCALDAYHRERLIKMTGLPPEPAESVLFTRMFKPKRLPKNHRVTGWWGSSEYLENQDARVLALCLAATAGEDFATP